MLNFKDASDFKGRNVNENLVNLKNNMDKLASAKDINVAYHLNAFNKTATGAEVWYWLGDPVGYAIAKKLSAAIANALGIVDRGPKATTNLYVIAQTKGVTILPEICFIDNKSDMKKYQANKAKLFKAMIDVYASFPQYNFKSTHGGHYGLNMVDPGAVGNGYKEAVVAQEINQAILKQQNSASEVPVTTPNPPVTAKNTKPVTNGKVGDKVLVFDALYADSYGAGRSTAKKGETGTIKKINTKGTKKYLIENWGWAHPNDIQAVTTVAKERPRHTIETYWYIKGGKAHKNLLTFIKNNKWAYKEVEGKDGRVSVQVGKFSQNSIYKDKLEKYLRDNNLSYEVKI